MRIVFLKLKWTVLLKTWFLVCQCCESGIGSHAGDGLDLGFTWWRLVLQIRSGSDTAFLTLPGKSAEETCDPPTHFLTVTLPFRQVELPGHLLLLCVLSTFFPAAVCNARMCVSWGWGEGGRHGRSCDFVYGLTLPHASQVFSPD